jgi:hypothetical protein
MPFRKGLSKYLKNTAYKYSLASRPTKNSRYILYSSTPAPIRRDDSTRTIITLRTFKDTLH